MAIDYETFKALFDPNPFTGPNDGKLLFWNNQDPKVEVKTATTSQKLLKAQIYIIQTQDLTQD